MGQAPLSGTEAPFIPPVGVGMDVSKIGGIPTSPGKDVPLLAFHLALWFGANFLIGAVFTWRELLRADFTETYIFV